jgi:hypothetical protein
MECNGMKDLFFIRWDASSLRFPQHDKYELSLTPLIFDSEHKHVILPARRNEMKAGTKCNEVKDL